MTAKFNLDTMNGIANFEQFAASIIHDTCTCSVTKPRNAKKMWEYEMFQADQQGDAWGYNENGTALTLANDMSAARMIYLRVAKQILAAR